jgi:CubicO group peptidase (beta-lactamase class C family)
VWAHAAGGLVGSARDLARWAQALHARPVVSAELYREMIQPARLADGSTQPYGFGLRLQELRGRKALVHGGSGRGIDTDSVYLPAEDLYVAVLANSEDLPTDPSTLTRRLAALALGEPIPSFTRADVPAAQLEPLFGSYKPGWRRPVRVLRPRRQSSTWHAATIAWKQSRPAKTASSSARTC